MNKCKRAARRYHYRKMYGSENINLADNRNFRNQGRKKNEHINQGIARQADREIELAQTLLLRWASQSSFIDDQGDKALVLCPMNRQPEQMSYGEMDNLARRCGWKEQL